MSKQKKIVFTRKSEIIGPEDQIVPFFGELCLKLKCTPRYLKERELWILPTSKTDTCYFDPKNEDKVFYGDHPSSYRLMRYWEMSVTPVFIANKGLVMSDSESIIISENEKATIKKEGLILVSEWSLGVVFASLGENCCSTLGFADTKHLLKTLRILQLSSRSIKGFYLSLFEGTQVVAEQFF